MKPLPAVANNMGDVIVLDFVACGPFPVAIVASCKTGKVESIAAKDLYLTERVLEGLKNGND